MSLWGKRATRATPNLLLAAGVIVALLGSSLTVPPADARTVPAAKLAQFSHAPAPKISGTAAVGKTLKATAGTWKPSAKISYQWRRDGKNISKATKSTYKVVSADAGKKITVRVTGTRSGYKTTSKTSPPKTVALMAFTTKPRPTISGSAQVGQKLTAKAGTWSPSAKLAFQWYRSGKAVVGATSKIYALTGRDAGTKVAVKVTGVRSGYATTSRLSAAKAVAAAVFTSAPTPSISGVARVGSMLTAGPGRWSPSATLTYRWLRDGSYIAGATSKSYTLTGQDARSEVAVRVTAKKPGYKTTSRTSRTRTVALATFAEAPVPQISGTAQVGSTLTAIAGAWRPTADLTFQWNRNGSPVAGATADNYRLQPNDAGQRISVTVLGRRAGYSAASRTSADTAIAGTHASMVVYVSGEIASDTTWSRSKALVYVLDATARVANGATLTIGSGVVVKGSLTVDEGGTLTAAGTSTAPVIFTDARDDTAGGDTNGDGAATSPDPTGGEALRVHDGATLSLSHVVVRNHGDLFGSVWPGSAYNASVEIRDSEITARVSLFRMTRPVIERTTIRSWYMTYGDGSYSGGGAVEFSQVEDVTGVVLSGKDRITVLGSPAARRITYFQSTVPTGRPYALTTESGVSAYESSEHAAGGLRINGNATIGSGVVVKGSLTVDEGGTLTAAGTSTAPVIFTDARDDTAGGDTNGDGAATSPDPTGGEALRLRITGGDTSRLSYVVFNHASTGLWVGEFTKVTVSNSKFVNTTMSIDVANAGSADPGTSYFYGNLPCAPPYDSVVVVDGTWFGAFGLPGISANAIDLTGIVVDDIATDESLGFVYGQMTGQLDLRGQTATNATPWRMYSCTIPVAPPITVAFPVTPVIVSTPATVEWLPTIAETR